MARHLRGAAICGNALEVRLADAEEAVLATVEQDVLRVEVLETALAKAVAALQTPTGDETEAGVLAMCAELAGLDAEAGRLAQAIAQGGDLPALVGLLQERERRRSHLRAELATVERRPPGRREAANVAHALDVMREALTDWQGMLRQETGPARQALRALLAGRLAFTPAERDGARFYTFSGEGTITPVIAGAAGVQRVAWLQRDSNPCFSRDHVFATLHE